MAAPPRAPVGQLARWAAILLLGAAFAFPLYWTVTMALKPPAEWNPPGRVVWFPQAPTLDNFRVVFGLEAAEESPFLQRPSRSALRPLWNSLIAAAGGTALALLCGVLTAFGLARFRAGGRLYPFALLQFRALPLVVLVIPLFFLWAELGLWDSLHGLVILYGGITLPLVAWLMRSFFLEVPREIAEAAIVDGCRYWGALFKAVLPQVRGGLAVTALFVFVLNWSDFLIAQVMTGERAETAPVFLASLQADEFERQYGPQAALSLVLLLPPVALGVALRRHLVRGLTLGAIRGRSGSP